MTEPRRPDDQPIDPAAAPRGASWLASDGQASVGLSDASGDGAGEATTGSGPALGAAAGSIG
jgi:hypothetical protein